jgi:uncharacterized protein
MMILEHDEDIRTLLSGATTIAVVGLSANPYRDSHRVAQYLLRHGYTIVPVNPHIKDVFGLRSYRSLHELPSPVDIVDIFRRPEYVPGIVHGAIAAGAHALWMQPGVGHPGAVRTATEAGLTVVVDRCIMTEHHQLTTE